MGANLSLAASLVGGPPWTSILEKTYAQKYQELFLFSKYFQTNLMIQKYSTVLDRQWTFVAVVFRVILVRYYSQNLIWASKITKMWVKGGGLLKTPAFWGQKQYFLGKICIITWYR